MDVTHYDGVYTFFYNDGQVHSLCTCIVIVIVAFIKHYDSYHHFTLLYGSCGRDVDLFESWHSWLGEYVCHVLGMKPWMTKKVLFNTGNDKKCGFTASLRRMFWRLRISRLGQDFIWIQWRGTNQMTSTGSLGKGVRLNPSVKGEPPQIPKLLGCWNLFCQGGVPL